MLTVHIIETVVLFNMALIAWLLCIHDTADDVDDLYGPGPFE